MHMCSIARLFRGPGSSGIRLTINDSMEVSLAIIYLLLQPSSPYFLFILVSPPIDSTSATAATTVISVEAGSSEAAQETTPTAAATSDPLPSTTAAVAVQPEETAVRRIVDVLPAAATDIKDSVPLPSSVSFAPTPVSIPEIPPPVSLPPLAANQVSTNSPTIHVKPTEVPTAPTPAAPTPVAVSTGHSKQAVVESTRLAITHLDTSSELPGIICEGPLYWANIILRDTAFQSVCHRQLANLLIHMSELIASNTDNIHILPIYDKNIRMTLQLCQLSYAPVQRYLPIDSKLIREVFPILILEVASAVLTNKNTTTTTTTSAAVPVALKETIVQTLIGNLSKEIDMIFSEESSSTSSSTSNNNNSNNNNTNNSNTNNSNTYNSNTNEVGGGGGGGGGGGEQVSLNAVEKERRRQLIESVVTMCIQKLSL